MKADHGKSTAVLQTVMKPLKGVLQDIQFSVDGDSERLKRASRWINAMTATSRHAGAYQKSQLVGSPNRSGATLIDNASRDPSAAPLLAIVIEKVGQIALAESC